MGPVQLLAQVETEGRQLWEIWQTQRSQLKLNEWSCYQPQLPPLALSEILLIRDMWCAHKSLPVLASFSLASKGKLRSRSAIASLSELCSDTGLLVLHYPHLRHISALWVYPAVAAFPCRLFHAEESPSWVGMRSSGTGRTALAVYITSNILEIIMKKQIYTWMLKWRMFVHWKKELCCRHCWKF